jgi:hypothetical protein
MTSIINGEMEEIDLETADQIWYMPVVKLWEDILALFEGKGRSGSSSFWSIMCAAIKSVNPNDKSRKHGTNCTLHICAGMITLLTAPASTTHL